MTPDCFPSRLEYLDWVHTARMHPPAPGHEFCEDCLPEYQAQMITLRRCQYPGTTFIEHGEGRDFSIIGKRPQVIVRKLKRDAELM
jgi:hypothetical protein